MMYRILLSFSPLLLWVWSCNPDRNKAIDPDKPRFQTSVSSQMFFKNVRKIYYNLTTDQTKREQFRMRNWQSDSALFQLNLCIIADWKNDRAYILFEPDQRLGDTVKLRRKDSLEPIVYVPGPIENHFTFVSKVYGCLQQKVELEAYSQGRWQEAFASSDQKETFRKTLVDFYRLVGLL
jgi:hypothetical protein